MSDVMEQIRKDISENEVVLYMKGTREMPQCGFSGRVIKILQTLGTPFETRNVLEDSGLRESIKEFSNWPTIPQLYVRGEFVGGSDIVSDLFQSGELQKLLGKK